MHTRESRGSGRTTQVHVDVGDDRADYDEAKDGI